MKKLQRWEIILTGIFTIAFLGQAELEAVATVVDSAYKNPGLNERKTETGHQSGATTYDSVSDPSTYWILFFGLAGLVVLLAREKLRHHLFQDSENSKSGSLLVKLFLLRRE